MEKGRKSFQLVAIEMRVALPGKITRDGLLADVGLGDGVVGRELSYRPLNGYTYTLVRFRTNEFNQSVLFCRIPA